MHEHTTSSIRTSQKLMEEGRIFNDELGHSHGNNEFTNQPSLVELLSYPTTTHGMVPLARAHSVLYTSGKYDFGFYGLVVPSTAVSVIPATVVNNMSSKQQFPTYWGLTQFRDAILDGCGK